MSAKPTPMMRQYRRIKGDLPPDVILFFRLGDFYEMFFEDARTAAPILDIALTKRNDVPMCGVPYHAVDSYLARLVRAGKRVAICDQVEDAEAAKGIVRREVTRIVTSGTVIEDAILDSTAHNYLAGVCRHDDGIGLALLDLSTGLFWGAALDDIDQLRDELRRHAPSECVIPESRADDAALCSAIRGLDSAIVVSTCEDWPFGPETARDNLVRHFGVRSLDGFGCEDSPLVVAAAGGVLHYVKEELRRTVTHIRSFSVRQPRDFLVLDEATCGNLDLVPRPGRPGSATLLGVVDVTQTAMGGRKLRDWILRPLADRGAISERHDAVAACVGNRAFLAEVREALVQVKDLARLIVRVSSGSGNARDVSAIGSSLALFPALRELVVDHPVPRLAALGRDIEPLPGLVDLIARAIADAPPPTLKDGGVIRDGYSVELDELRRVATEGRKWIAEYQATEQGRTGIKTLKVRHNKVFGYYIEVSKAQLANVPEDYVRKQTLVNAERFISPDLKEYESKVLGAHDRAIALEAELFAGVREEIVREMDRIQAAAEALAELDVLAALADRALALRYVRPEMTDNGVVRITDGRHPVVEQMPDSERFVPNDALLDNEQNQLIIITGPNMAGKSTYIRQVALIVILAQMGSFVPASEAVVGVVDRVFTRVGASDDLARGRSTFMVEMQETANILNNATPKSLVVLDEIGRGTSTFDGISIAWAVAEYLHNTEAVRAKTLFATHYHELTDLELAMGGVKNYNVLVRETDDRVVFLRKIVRGGSDKSYGIQVARLAGLPQDVVERAKEILANLEEGEFGESGQPKIARRRSKRSGDSDTQMTLFPG